MSVIVLADRRAPNKVPAETGHRALDGWDLSTPFEYVLIAASFALTVAVFVRAF